jgi:hypothetical protein
MSEELGILSYNNSGCNNLERSKYRSLRRHTCRWVDIIKIDLREMRLGCRMNSLGSEQGPVAASYEHGHEPSG